MLTDLRTAETQVAAWGDDVQSARDSLLSEQSFDAGLLDIRAKGQLLRQRVAAGVQLDDIGFRIRTMFPFPVALPWRRAQTASPSPAGYQAVLHCAEVLTGYLAALTIVMARHVGVELGPVAGLRRKLSERPHGVSMSDWTEIVRSAMGKQITTVIGPKSPLVELSELMGDGSDAYDALRDLTAMRNDLAHGRGPQGSQVAGAFHEALERLTDLFGACEWLMDYPVRLVEDTRWDSYSGSGTYTYRELTGDHHLVQQREATIGQPTLNKGRLYIADRAGSLHLLSPLVLWHECDECRVPSAFLLDAFDRGARVCRMRATDHNHIVHRDDVVGQFASLGLLGAEYASKRDDEHH